MHSVSVYTKVTQQCRDGFFIEHIHWCPASDLINPVTGFNKQNSFVWKKLTEYLAFV